MLKCKLRLNCFAFFQSISYLELVCFVKYVSFLLRESMTYDDQFNFIQALQAPTCHENMVKVGAYILGEFGNLIAGDERSG